ncbi:MAG: hypothetical protein IPN20_22720 [Haliscomenobacter sp.]|nr:hypothetical protein [Haliscomenobacter sp.]
MTNEQLFAIATHHKGVTGGFDDTGRLSSMMQENLIEEHIPRDLALLQRMPEFLTIWNQHFQTAFTIKTDLPDPLTDAGLPHQIFWLLNKDFQKRAYPDATRRLRLAETEHY